MKFKVGDDVSVTLRDPRYDTLYGTIVDIDDTVLLCYCFKTYTGGILWVGLGNLKLMPKHNRNRANS